MLISDFLTCEKKEHIGEAGEEPEVIKSHLTKNSANLSLFKMPISENEVLHAPLPVLATQGVVNREGSRSSSRSSLHHTIKRNIGSSTTSLSAFTTSSQQDKPNHLVSLSPFEYALPATHSGSGYFNGQHGNPAGSAQSQRPAGAPEMNTLDSEDLDFDTAYNMITGNIENFLSDGPPNNFRPTTPENTLNALQYKSPNTLSQQRFREANEQKLYQDHRKAIIEAGFQMMSQEQDHQQQQQPQMQQQQIPGGKSLVSPFTVSPHTRNLLNSVNNMSSMYQMNGSGYELLSITESSALEKFLDSVVDDSKLNDLGRHWPSIDPLLKHEGEFSVPVLEPGPVIPELKLQRLNTELSNVNPIPNNHALMLSYALSSSASPAPNFEPESSLEPVKKKRGRKRKNATTTESSDKVKSESSPETELKSKRQMLTQEQKKLNHTESEKKRRALIKTSYDNLLSVIDKDKCYHLRQGDKKNSVKRLKRENSRYAVMQCVIDEIEYLLKANQEMRERLGK